MKNLLIISFVLIQLLVLIQTQISNDKITSLPGLNGLLGEQYSGYLEVNSTHGRFLHYWFVKSVKGKDAPLVLWLNGGPGCSSLDGYLYEHGPYNWGQGDDNITLVDNPYSWHLEANMLYLEAPAGVGFSYSLNTADYVTGDKQTAEDNFNFLKKWFEGYPQYKLNDFYISGESYAGAYVPSLANRIVEGNKRFESSINLKGILVGNGVTDPAASNDLNNLFPFAYGHALYSYQTELEVRKYCTSDPNGQKCNDLTNQIYSVFDNIDIYDIYSSCYHQRPITGKDKFSLYKKLQREQGNEGIIPCTDSTKADKFLNNIATKKAIHVRTNIKWTVCNDFINENYIHDIPTMIPLYKNLIASKLRIFVFSGDVDASVPFTGTQYWTSHFGLTLKSLWKPWNVDSQVAGFVTEYEGLTFATVKGAGHMVPQTNPIQAFAMFSRYLKNGKL